MKWFYGKDKVVKKNKKSGLIEKQWKNSKLNKIYTVQPRINDCVTLYDVEGVLFDNNGEVIKAPPLTVSTWADCKIVHLTDVTDED